MDSKVKPIHTLGTKEKMEVLRALDDGISVQKICKDFNASKSQIYRIREKRKHIEENNNVGTSGLGKRCRKSTMIDIDKALKMWFDNMMTKKSARITGPILQAKAIELSKSAAEAKGEDLDDNFTISASWIQRWKIRNKIIWKKEEGEIAASDFTAAEQWKSQIMPGLLARYDDKDIWNADETGDIFISMLF